MTKNEIELIKSLKSLTDSISYIKGVQTGVSDYISINPKYYENCIKSIEEKLKEFTEKLYEVLELNEE